MLQGPHNIVPHGTSNAIDSRGTEMPIEGAKLVIISSSVARSGYILASILNSSNNVANFIIIVYLSVSTKVVKAYMIYIYIYIKYILHCMHVKITYILFYLTHEGLLLYINYIGTAVNVDM